LSTHKTLSTCASNSFIIRIRLDSIGQYVAACRRASNFSKC
jgi:hypothetical protein